MIPTTFCIRKKPKRNSNEKTTKKGTTCEMNSLKFNQIIFSDASDRTFGHQFHYIPRYLVL